ncbi:MAG: hypothetical protein HYT76_05850 [Deltaproteobacteria bacterium]|nr:hypothetical protein [Deltaproteobacteria bacterium]
MSTLLESPELKTLERVIERLNRASIPYMLTGSMALNFYGHPRATNDFDIVIEVESRDTERLITIFQDGFYISREAVQEALNLERMFNILDEETIFKVDLIVRKNDPFSREQFQRRRLKELGSIKGYVISPEDLILAKLEWSKESRSEMQERDIRNLVTLLSDELDYSYLERWAERLGFLERLKQYYVSP